MATEMSSFLFNMADSTIAITAGTGTAVDTRTESTNGHHRQVVVLGDPATNAGVAPVDATAGLKVDLGADNDVVVTNAGTFATQATLQAGSAAIGKLAANSGVDIGDVDVTSSALPTGASTSAKQPALGTAGTASTDVITVQGIASMTALKVDGSAVTQPVSGTVTANLSATDNAVLDSIQAGTDKIPALGQALAAGSVPVVMTASQLTTLTPPAAITGFATSAKQDTIIGHVDGVETLLGTIDSKLGGTLTVTGGGGGTEYTEDAAAAANPVGTVLQLIREDARAGGLTTTDGDNVAVRGNNKGEMYVKTTDSDALLTTIDADTGTIATEVAGLLTDTELRATPVPVSGTVAVTNAGITTIAGAVTGTEMQVDVLTMPTTAVTQSGTWDEVGINDSGNSITVDYATTGSGTATGALRVELPTNGTGVIATVGAVTAITNALPAGTNAIGKLSANSGVDIGDVDVTSVIAGTGATNLGKAEDAGHTTGDTGVFNLGVRVDSPNVALTNTDADYSPITTNKLGSLRTAALEDDLATAATTHTYKYYTNAGAVTDGIVWSPAAGKRWFLTSLTINVSAASTVTIEDDVAAGDVVRFKFEFAANSGITIPFSGVPMFSGEDAADLLVTTTAGNVYITCVGYEI